MSSFGVPQREEWDDDPRAWRTLAACKGEDPAIFYPEPIAGRPSRAINPDEYAEARTFCATCPVRDDCGEWALKTNQSEGMWGNMSPHQRKKIRQTRRERSRRMGL